MGTWGILHQILAETINHSLVWFNEINADRISYPCKAVRISFPSSRSILKSSNRNCLELVRYMISQHPLKRHVNSGVVTGQMIQWQRFLSELATTLKEEHRAAPRGFTVVPTGFGKSLVQRCNLLTCFPTYQSKKTLRYYKMSPMTAKKSEWPFNLHPSPFFRLFINFESDLPFPNISTAHSKRTSLLSYPNGHVK